MKCRATDCPDDAETSGLCRAHYQDWRTTIDRSRNANQIKARIEKSIPLDVAPRITRLGEFA